MAISPIVITALAANPQLNGAFAQFFFSNYLKAIKFWTRLDLEYSYWW